VSFVLDNSVSMCWLLRPEKAADIAFAERVLASLATRQAHVPALWFLEAANVIAKAESRGFVTEARAQAFIALLRQLNIADDKATAAQALGDTLNLARRYKLSAYDAAYLELAMRLGVPLVTLDTDLAKAAKKAGVPAFVSK
jgi:predicted nucleic acid-binding protein